MKKILISLAVVTFIVTLVASCSQASVTSAAQPVTPPSGQTGNGQVATPPANNAGQQGTVPPSNDAGQQAVRKNVPQTVKVAEILGNQKTYGGKTVIVEGRIATECPSGCWFTLKDGSAVIYIDLLPSNIVIPQKKGAFARVTAEVIDTGGDVYLIGKKVEF